MCWSSTRGEIERLGPARRSSGAQEAAADGRRPRSTRPASADGPVDQVLAARGRCPGSRSRGAAPTPRARSVAPGSPSRAAELLDEVPDQARDVLAPLAAAAAAGARRRVSGSRGPRGKSPPRPALSRSRFVAATTRTSTGIGRSPPMRTISRSCSARRSLACSAERPCRRSRRGRACRRRRARTCRAGAATPGGDAPLDAEELALEERLRDSARS